jgi:hypothetical protein
MPLLSIVHFYHSPAEDRPCATAGLFRTLTARKLAALIIENVRRKTMSFIKCLVPALLAGAFMCSPASAMPGSASSKNLTSAVDPAVIQVNQNKNHRVVVK